MHRGCLTSPRRTYRKASQIRSRRGGASASLLILSCSRTEKEAGNDMEGLCLFLARPYRQSILMIISPLRPPIKSQNWSSNHWRASFQLHNKNRPPHPSTKRAKSSMNLPCRRLITKLTIYTVYMESPESQPR